MTRLVDRDYLEGKISSLEVLLETERHKRMVAEQGRALAEARVAAAVIYLESLTYSPLKERLLKILRGTDG